MRLLVAARDRSRRRRRIVARARPDSCYIQLIGIFVAMQRSPLAMINLLLPDQVRELQQLAAVVETIPDLDTATRTLVATMSTIVGCPVALIERRGSIWRPVDVAAGITTATLDEISRQLPDSSADADLVAVTTPSARAWTCMRLRLVQSTRPLWLLMQGDWTLSEPLLRDGVALFVRSLDAVERRGGTQLRRRRIAQVFPRRLAAVTDPEQTYRLTVSCCARSVNAAKASLALFNQDHQSLAIAATYGYPEALVRHVRVRPGTGVIGSVFRSRRPMRVDDIARLRDAPPPRRRYLTPSFIAVPLIGADAALGVLCVADRRDGNPFDRNDLTILRTMAGVATLALERIRAMDLASMRERDAAIDPLTGLFNRGYFQARLEEEVERARRQRIPLTVLMLDIDNFKQLNDRHGHPAGDALLRGVADVLRRTVRVFDVCARFGGDEFAVLMPGSGQDASAQIAARIREEVQHTRPAGLSLTDDLGVTVSIGIRSAVGATGVELIGLADQALYAAKREGKNRIKGGLDVSGL